MPGDLRGGGGQVPLAVRWVRLDRGRSVPRPHSVLASAPARPPREVQPGALPRQVALPKEGGGSVGPWVKRMHGSGVLWAPVGAAYLVTACSFLSTRCAWHCYGTRGPSDEPDSTSASRSRGWARAAGDKSDRQGTAMTGGHCATWPRQQEAVRVERLGLPLDTDILAGPGFPAPPLPAFVHICFCPPLPRL